MRSCVSRLQSPQFGSVTYGLGCRPDNCGHPRVLQLERVVPLSGCSATSAVKGEPDRPLRSGWKAVALEAHAGSYRGDPALYRPLKVRKDAEVTERGSTKWRQSWRAWK